MEPPYNNHYKLCGLTTWLKCGILLFGPYGLAAKYSAGRSKPVRLRCSFDDISLYFSHLQIISQSFRILMPVSAKLLFLCEKF